LRLGLYGNFTWDNLFVTSSPTFGIHLLNGERAITATEKAKNDRTGFDFSWFNRAGYTFALPAEFFITPSYALGMTYLHDPAHSEYGVAAPVKYHDYDNWSLLQTLDVRVGRLFRVSDCFALLPEIWGGWEHEYLDPNSATTTLGVGATSITDTYRVPGIAQDRAVLGAGLTTLIRDKYEISARYDERLWDGGHLSQFSLGLSVKF
jgi:outer membrane autotransporter protein